MARLVFAMNLSLDGYVDHDRMATGPELFRHWTQQVRDGAGSFYGRRMYETMRYFDEDRPEWTPAQWDFARAWRAHPKWVVSRTLASVGPNAALVAGDLAAAVRQVKAGTGGELSVSGPELAHGLAQLGLVDEIRLYLHPVVLGGGKPFFAGALPPLRYLGSERVGEDVVRLSYAPQEAA